MILLELFLLFFLPFALLYFGVISLRHRRKIFAGMFCLLLFFIWYQGIGLRELGIRTDNLGATALPYLIFLVGGVLVFFLFIRLLRRPTAISWKKNAWYLVFFAPLCFAQQIAYQGFLIHELQQVSASFWLIVFADATLFAFAHVIYPESDLGLPIVFVTGVAFSSMYLVFPNLILISIVHATLNFIVVGLYGFFSLEDGSF